MTRLTGPRPGAVTGLLAACVLLKGCGGPAARPSPTDTGGGATPAPTACPAVGAPGCPSLPVGTVLPSALPTSSTSSPSATTSTTTTAGPTPTSLSGFWVASVTFASAQDGWVLGTGLCSDGGGSCLALARTQDGGITWTPVPPPPTTFYSGAISYSGATSSGSTGGVDGIRFANPEDGWAYGTQLWATHDGGASWTQVLLPGPSSSGPIMLLETSAGYVDAALFSPVNAAVAIDTSSVGADSWTAAPVTLPIGAGPLPNTQFILHGSAGWLLQNDREVIGGARLQGDSWGLWTPPCGAVGGQAALAASSTEDLIAACAVGQYTSTTATERAYVSGNGGDSFSELATPLPSACQAVSLLASASSSVAAAGCGGEIVATFNGGGTWSAVYDSGAGPSIVYLGFTTTTQGVAIEASASSSLGSLLMTHDGGQTWVAVDI